MKLLTHYMGLQLRNPLIAAPSPLTAELATLRALEDHGAAAVVLPSLFEEQLRSERSEHERAQQLPASGSPEAQTYFPACGELGDGAQRYLRMLQRAKEALDIPVIGSLNCLSRECWPQYARQIEAAGADALELNFGASTPDLAVTGREVEEACLQVLATVRAGVRIPVAVKIGPYFSSLGAIAQDLCTAGADALVLFDRFCQPDIDIRTLHRSFELELSTAWESRLPQLWIARLHGRIPVSLAASTGVQNADDVYKFLLVGADAVMTASALLRHGVPYMHELLAGLEGLLTARGLDSLEAVRGRMSEKHLAAPDDQPHASYVRMLQLAHVGSRG